MSIINYNNPIITDWNVDEFGKKVSVEILNETHQVVQNKIVLNQLPDEQARVFINETFVEINIKDNITQVNQFKVDYSKSGVVYLHETLDGQFITIQRYKGRGVTMYPSSRVWVKLDINGNVIQTMDGAFDVLANQSNDVQALRGTRIHEGIVQPIDTSFWYDPSDE